MEPLRREVNPPGQELFPEATTVILTGYLSDAFWLGKLDGFYGGYTESDGIVSPESGDTDLARDWQQLIVFYAGMKIIENSIRNTNTSFRVEAGPVQYETQNSSTLLREHLRALIHRRDMLLEQLSQRYQITASYLDAVSTRSQAIADGILSFNSGTEF